MRLHHRGERASRDESLAPPPARDHGGRVLTDAGAEVDVTVREREGGRSREPELGLVPVEQFEVLVDPVVLGGGSHRC